MSNDVKAREFFHQLTLSDLPVGVYLVAPDGNLLECNACCRKMLALPPKGPLNCAITKFHCMASERSRLWELAAAAEAQGKPFENVPVALSVNSSDVFVRESIRVLRDTEDRHIIGYLGFMIDITNEQRYQRLFEHLPVGIYRVDPHDTLVYVNDAAVKILGYESKAEIINRHVKEFYAYPEEAAVLSEMTKKQGRFTKEVRELVKKNGEFIFASISSVAIIGVDGSFDGREGTLVDVTNEEHYRRSLQDVPVGFYEVRIVNSRDIIRSCNLMFAKMHDCATESEVVGHDINQFYASPEDYRRFLEELYAKEAAGLPLQGYVLKIKTQKGRQRLFEVSSRLIKDRSDRIVGRMGVVRDVSKEEKLRDEMKLLQNDIGRVLHAYTTAILTTRHAVTSAITSLGPDPFSRNKVPSIDEIDELLGKPAACLGASLEGWIRSLESSWQQRGIPQNDWTELAEVLHQLQNYRSAIPLAEVRPHTLRGLSRKIIEIFTRLDKQHLPKEQNRHILNEAIQLERLVCIATLRQVETELMAMDHQVRAFREHITTSARFEEAPRVFRFWDLVKQSMVNLGEYAHSEGVEFRAKDETHNAHVLVSVRDVLRAVSNLLHNAIKYSWAREKGAPPWIAIHAFIKAESVCVMFENYGVPIPDDEIKQGLIFQFGYRGRLSSDRGRLGTGIGLTDARRTARHFGGDVVVESTCAWRGAAPNDYRAPYLTRVTLSLPLHAFTGD